jgi:hypothetical protein
MSDRTDKKLDELLDCALAEYSNVEPRVGLENRILAGLESGRKRNWIWEWKWGVAFAVAVLILVIVLIPHEKKNVEVGTNTPAVRISGDSGSPQPQANRPESLHPLRRALATQHRQPRAAVPHNKVHEVQAVAVVKQPVFPAPSPLSDQEKLLLAYLRRTPYQELVKNSKPDEPKPNMELNQVVPGQISDSNSNSR